MKTLKLAGFVAVMLALPAAYAQKGSMVFPRPPRTNMPPKVYIVEPPPPPLYTLEKKEKGLAAAEKNASAHKTILFSRQQAKTIIDRFKQAYPGMGNPRCLVYFPNKTGSEMQAWFDRPLREAGVALADQKAAARIMAGKPLDDFLGEADTPAAQKKRQELIGITDVVIEVAVSSRQVPVSANSEAQTITVPDVQATAISLKDSRILGQAMSSDLLDGMLPSTLAEIHLREVTRATALALLQDMTPKD